RYVTEVWGDNLELLDRKPDGGAQGNKPPFPEPPAAAAPRTATAAPAQTQTTTPLPASDESDDLPF
ncbi:MAG: hypothetical protein LBO74_14055, partial [Candidatus Symbiothrix sp.]|nr:hypothetical protein [Candidatus Symbiothrix sp.]